MGENTSKFKKGQQVWFLVSPWSVEIREGIISGVFEDGYAVKDLERRQLLIPLDCAFAGKETALKAVIAHLREKKRGIEAGRVLLDEQGKWCDNRLDELQPRDVI